MFILIFSVLRVLQLCCVYILIVNSLYCHIIHVFVKHMLLCAFDMQK